VSEALPTEIRHLRSLEGSPRDPDGRIFLPLADAHIRAGDLETAEELLVEGLARHPEFVAAHVLAAQLREAQGNLDGAELAYAAARRLDPDNVEVMFGLGRIMAGRGEEVGVTLVERARAIDPTAGRGVSRPASTPTPEEVELASIADPAPDAEVVSIADLAPDASEDAVPGTTVLQEAEVVSIADLAPDAVGASEPAEAPRSEEPPPQTPTAPERRVVTRTLAELLVKQGQHAEAIGMYRTLVDRNPDDGSLRARLEELHGGTPDAEEGAEDEVHHPSAPEPTPDAPTPFAWTEAGHARESDDDGREGPPVSEYFHGLLSWSPRASTDGDA